MRNLELADIIRRAPRDSFKIVSPADFQTSNGRGVDAARLRTTFVPYCIHPVERKSLYVDAGDVKPVAQARLQYQHLRRSSTAILRVPWERRRLYGDAAVPAILAFSVGRCGSTLLCEAMRSCGVFTISEPDFFTQAVGVFLLAPGLSAHLPQVVADLESDLVVACGGSTAPEALIKLRAQCCKAPHVITRTHGSAPRTLFMIRAFEAWAASTLRASARPPLRVVERYLDGLRCLRWLRRNTTCHVVRYEDLIADPEGALLEAGQLLTLTIDPGRLKRALGSDAQAGTGLSRERLANRTLPPQALARTVALWRDVRPAGLLRELGLLDYC